MVHLVPDFDKLLISNPSNLQTQLFNAGREIIWVSFWWTILMGIIQTIYAILFFIPDSDKGRPTWEELKTFGSQNWVSWYAMYIQRVQLLVNHWMDYFTWDVGFSLINFSSLAIIILASMYLLRG